MKILRDGPAWEQKRECARCKSLLLIEEQDVRYTKKVNKPEFDEPYTSVYYYFACGKCHEETRLIEKDLPERVVKAAYAEWERGEAYN